MADQRRRSPGQVEGGFIDSPIFNFRDKIEDLARPNLFQVEIQFPEIVTSGRPNVGGTQGSSENRRQEEAGASGDSLAGSNMMSTFLVKAANLPASTIGVIEVPYRGRMLKIAGDRTFEPWTVTVLNDQEFRLRTKFEEWASRIQALQQNIQDAKEIGDYQSNAIVRQYSRQGDQKKAYTFQGIWPSSISAIDLAWDNNDTPEEYTVEFQVQFWSFMDDVNAGNAKQKAE
jgi:hypothetical protein|tara:strand:- start:68 stop:757 length:690 start_codon:yes stop_codon:yes gene_type:complete